MLLVALNISTTAEKVFVAGLPLGVPPPNATISPIDDAASQERF